jgi:DNA-binding transcriptional LysR family regulator
MLDVHRLRVFRSVVASGSIQAAAVNLGYTASAVSQHVSALQRETGLTLVTRIGRGIEPTAAGLALADEIDGVLSRLGDVESFVADLRAGRAGGLSIAYFASVGSAWMPTVVRELLRQFPHIRLNLVLRDDLPANANERADIQIIVEQDEFQRRLRSGIIEHLKVEHAYHLLDDPYVAVMNRHHPFAERTSVELATLATEPWVDNDLAHGWCRRNLLQACQAAGFAPPFRVETQDYPTAIAFVDAGIGLTVLPRLAARNLPPGVVAVPVTAPTPQRSIYALVQPAVEDTAPARAVLATLAECASAERGRRLLRPDAEADEARRHALQEARPT